MQEELLTKLTNRHLAKLLDKLEEIDSPEIIKDAVKKELWYFSNDIRDQVLSVKQGESICTEDTLSSGEKP